MDYITTGILDDINFLRRKNSPKIYSTLAQYYRMLFEYHLMLMFACLWDRKENLIPLKTRSEIVNAMSKPILGTTLSFIMKMNATGAPVFDLGKKYEEVLRDFVNDRNQNFGHRIIIPNVQEVYYRELYEKLEKNYRTLVKFEEKFWGNNREFLLRQDPVEQSQLIIFQANRRPQYRDVEKRIAQDYGQNELYFSCEEGYFRVSPFILAKDRNGVKYDFYCFTRYKLQSGKFDYYRISEIDNDLNYPSEIFPKFFMDYRQENKYTIRRANGVISNKFENNYDYFVNIPPFTKYVTQIWDFMLNNKSTTCMTIRGVGGIGKTALVHYICTNFLFERMTDAPEFNCVIFCSAKDREFRLNTKTARGQIYSVDTEKIADSYIEILRTVSNVLEIGTKPDTKRNIKKIEDALLKESGVLFIIDDLETINDAEKEKIVNLISRMQIDRHKVLITTRSQYVIGLPYDVEHMNEDQVISFMEERFKKIENHTHILQQFHELLKQDGMRKKIYETTQGLPLLTIQLATLMPLKGFAENLLSKRFSNDAEDFLLGRLYYYFDTATSKLLFLIIALFFKCKLQNIPLFNLQIFYELYCRRSETFSGDFDNDMRQLKNWNILKVEDDSVLVSNNISYKVFEQCVENFSKDFPNEKLFEERLVKCVASDGLNKGLLKYFDFPEAVIDEPLIELFVFDNVCKFTNDERYELIKRARKNFAAAGDTEKIQMLYSRGKDYFDDTTKYALLFEEDGLAKKENAPQSLSRFAALNKKLTAFKQEVTELLRKPRSVIEEESLQLYKELNNLCTNDLRMVLEDFSPDDLSEAQNTLNLLRNLFRYFKDLARHENVQQLIELLKEKKI